jgi:hypothetical protein
MGHSKESSRFVELLAIIGMANAIMDCLSKAIKLLHEFMH